MMELGDAVTVGRDQEEASATGPPEDPVLIMERLSERGPQSFQALNDDLRELGTRRLSEGLYRLEREGIIVHTPPEDGEGLYSLTRDSYLRTPRDPEATAPGRRSDPWPRDE
ncbi:MAG: hypothetical protein KY455_01130 [Euryarchaeota archaeon]|nr:hypothetical protein [Euryarchaeota archaeon]